MKSKTWRWVLGLVYILTVASIWIAASFVVQSVVDAGVSPFLVTYICNSLFVIYIPLIEIVRYLEDKYGTLLFWQKKDSSTLQEDSGESEEAILLDDKADDGLSPSGVTEGNKLVVADKGLDQGVDAGLDAKGRWTRSRVAKVSLLLCPFWFLAQLTFNLSLKYTTVTSNTILSSSSSLFTFLVSLVFLGEIFSWVKLISVLLCMGGTIIVSLGDSKSGSNKVASNPVLGDILALLSSTFYAVYITLIRKKLPDDDGKSGHTSMAQFLGFLGLFNLLIFLPIPLVLNFANLEPFNTLTWKQLGLIVGKDECFEMHLFSQTWMHDLPRAGRIDHLNPFACFFPLEHPYFLSGRVDCKITLPASPPNLTNLSSRGVQNWVNTELSKKDSIFS